MDLSRNQEKEYKNQEIKDGKKLIDSTVFLIREWIGTLPKI